MNKEKLVRTSCHINTFVRENGLVKFFIERYAKADNLKLTKLWIVNGEHEFKKERDAHIFTVRLCDKVGGSGKVTDDSYSKTIKSYTTPTPEPFYLET
jgi:hypothetical protein